jgi:hypothetical protein
MRPVAIVLGVWRDAELVQQTSAAAVVTETGSTGCYVEPAVAVVAKVQTEGVVSDAAHPGGPTSENVGVDPAVMAVVVVETEPVVSQGPVVVAVVVVLAAVVVEVEP